MPGLSSTLCLFSSFLDHPGGIQQSGQSAWRGIAGNAGAADFFCYGRAETAHYSGARRAAVAQSRVEAVFKAARSSWRVETVLIWHAALVPLLPFFRFHNSNRRSRPRIKVFLHGLEIDRLVGKWTRQSLMKVDEFLCNSESTAKRFVDTLPELAGKPRSIVRLGAGCPESGGQEYSRECAAIILGRMEAGEDYKGHREVIQAWHIVRKRYPKAELWVVGDGGLRQDFERLADRCCSGAVRFWGYVSNDKRDELLARSRCLVMPSTREGFGLAYAEAMRLGTPCIVSNADAGREIVSPPEAGLAVDPAAPEQLADAICRMLEPGRIWDRWSERALVRYEQNFTEQHFHARLLAALVG
jgi:phosphatidylinositol alpha-1,6-mannosyltransferase